MSSKQMTEEKKNKKQKKTFLNNGSLSDEQTKEKYASFKNWPLCLMSNCLSVCEIISTQLES